MNKKGFTLIEIIGAIIILGIISIIAFNTYTSSMRGFRDDYYTDLTKTLRESGKEFFNDNRKYRPNGILEAQKITVNGLVTEKYIDDVLDYNGDACDLNTSYVMVVKEGKDKYTYHTCLVCSSDEYSNTDDSYCDSSWLDPTKVEYGIGRNLNAVYVYRGTGKDELKDLLEMPISYVRRNYNNEIIAEAEGDGKDNLPTVSPVDIDVVDTNKIGTYKVTYEYSPLRADGTGVIRKEVQERTVIVYENSAPGINITYENKRSDVSFDLGALGVTNKTGNGSVQTDSGNYVPGTWAQRITVSINGSEINIPEEGVSISRYQWNKGGVWQDFCLTDNNCSVEIASDMNEEIKFRMVASNGKISQETSPILIRRDYTPPTCDLSLTGDLGQRNGSSTGWYISNVGIGFASKDDVLGTTENAKSGVKVSNIYTSTSKVDRLTSNTGKTQSADVASVTYVGYVEDNAGNFVTCRKTIKKDGTAPVCTFTLSGTKGSIDGTETGWYVSNVGVSIGESDNISGTYQYGIGSDSTSHSVTHSNQGSSISYSGFIEDNAGNTNTCNTSFKMDKTKPTCTLSMPAVNGENGWYKSSSVTITFGTHSDNLSGVNAYGIGSLTGGTTYNQTANGTNLSQTGHIRDNAGNTNTCSTGTFMKDDGSGATCVGIGGNSTWKNVSSIMYGAKLNNAPISGCKTFHSDIETYYADCSGDASYDISDGTVVKTASYGDWVFYTRSGVSINCSPGTLNVYSDRAKPTCTVDKSNTWTESGVTTTVTCNDTGGSGCKSGNPTGDTRLTSGKEYTVSDNAGNTNKCSVTVSSQTQSSIQSCTKGDTCSSAGCYRREACEAAGCKTYKCSSGEGGPSPDNYCYTGSLGAQAYDACAEANHGSNYHYGGICWSSRYEASCSEYNTGPECPCAQYNESIERCGCVRWGTASGWSDDPTCSPSTTNSTIVYCRTVYY